MMTQFPFVEPLAESYTYAGINVDQVSGTEILIKNTKSQEQSSLHWGI